MPRMQAFFFVMLVAFAMSWMSVANARPPQCDARTTRALAGVEHGAQQTLVVESFGACSDPLLLIWIDRPAARVQQLHFARLAAYDRRVRTPATVAAVVRDIMARIESRPASAIERWAKLQGAEDAPGGASWRGTPLRQSDYERIASSAKHVLLIPTDATRAKLAAWDGAAEEWIDVVYYGD